MPQNGLFCQCLRAEYFDPALCAGPDLGYLNGAIEGSVRTAPSPSSVCIEPCPPKHAWKLSPAGGVAQPCEGFLAIGHCFGAFGFWDPKADYNGLHFGPSAAGPGGVLLVKKTKASFDRAFQGPQFGSTGVSFDFVLEKTVFFTRVEKWRRGVV